MSRDQRAPEEVTLRPKARTRVLWLGVACVVGGVLMTIYVWLRVPPLTLDANPNNPDAVLDSGLSAPKGTDAGAFKHAILQNAATAPSALEKGLEAGQEKRAARTSTRLMIYVTDAIGRPLAIGAAEVELRRQGNTLVKSVDADQGVLFVFDDVPLGMWDVHVTAQHKAAQVIHTSLDADHPLAVHYVHLEPDDDSLIAIRFVDSQGQALKLLDAIGLGSSCYYSTEMVAVATDVPPGPFLPDTWLDNYSCYDRGVYLGPGSSYNASQRPTGDTHGVLEVFGDTPCYVSAVARHVVLDTKRIEPGTRAIEFVLDRDALHALPAMATLRVCDARSRQVPADCRASLCPRGTASSGDKPDEAGVVVFQRVMPGLMQLKIRAESYEEIDKTIAVKPGASMDLGTITLSHAARLSGVVRLDSGVPITGGELSIVSMTEYQQRYLAGGGGVSVVEVHHDGSFECDLLGPHRYWICGAAGNSWGLSGSAVDLTETDELRLDLTATAGVLVTVRCDDLLTDDAWVCISHDSGFPEAEWPLQSAEDRLVRQQTQAVHLCAGNYRASLWVGAREVRHEDFEVQAAPLSVMLNSK